MKTLALDIGDVWTGSAISDELGITARPYKTVTSKEIISFLTQLLEQEPITTIVIGYPITMRGTQSAQTIKVVETQEELQKMFPHITFTLFDERMTSKQAAGIKPTKTKEDKIASHSVAAALILSTYLMFASNR